MTISSQTLCFEARRKCAVGFIHTQLASSYANAPQQLASSPSTVGFITRDFHALISRQHSQTNRRGLHTLFLTPKYRCMQKNQLCRCPILTTQNVLSWSGRFGGGHTGWSQLQLASSVSPLWYWVGWVGQMRWYSFRCHTSHAICFGFAMGVDLLRLKYSTNMQIQTFQLSEKMIDLSSNHNAYNQVTQITHSNFNWGMLGASSYL